MNQFTIDTAMTKRMVEASAISGASIIGCSGGWMVMLKLGLFEKPLGTQRSGQPRLWRSLDRCVDYLKHELKIVQFDMLDSTHYSTAVVSGKNRVDTAERMRRAHQAAAHDKWFREQVEQGVHAADDPNTHWITHEEAQASWVKKRTFLMEKQGKGN